MMLWLLVSASPIDARELYVEPSSRLRAEFDDNIQLLTDNHSDAYGFIASMSANSGMRTGQFNIALKSGVDIYQYWGQKNLDRENFNIGLLTDYRFNEKNKFGFNLDYISDTSLTSELLTTGFLGGSTRQNAQIGRERINVAPSWSYFLSDLQILKAGYAHEEVTYEKSNNSFLNSYRTDSGELSYTHQWSPELQYFVSLGAMRYELQDFYTIIDNYSANLGFDYKYSETLSFNVMVGGRDTESEFGPTPGLTPQQQVLLNANQSGITSTSSLGSLFALGMKKQFEVDNLTLNYTRNTSPTAGGVLLQADSFNANLEHQFTEQLKLMLSGSANFNSSTSSANTSYNRDYYTVESRLGWMLAKQLNLVGGYRYRTQQYDTSSVSASSNTFFVYFDYQWDKIASNRF